VDQRDDLLTILGTEIPAAYHLGAMRPLRYLENTHQRRHKKIVVESEKGKYLAKTYTNDAVTLDSLYFQHNLSNFLYSHDLPVAQILRTHAGKSFIAKDNWAVELQSFLSGGPMPLTVQTLKVAGSCSGETRHRQEMPVSGVSAKCRVPYFRIFIREFCRKETMPRCMVSVTPLSPFWGKPQKSWHKKNGILLRRALSMGTGTVAIFSL
jgi:hypothetical protein